MKIVRISALLIACVSAVPVLPTAESSPLRGMAHLPAVDTRLALANARLALDADVFAAAGCTTSEVESVVARLREKLGSESEQFDACESAVSDARRELASLRAQRAKNAGSVSESAILAAEGNLRSAIESRDTRYASLWTYASEAINQGRRTIVNVIRSNKDRPAPIQYKAKTRTDAEWEQLAKALNNLKQRRTNQSGGNSEATTIIAAFDAESETAAAASNLTQLSDSLRTTWKSAIGS